MITGISYILCHLPVTFLTSLFNVPVLNADPDPLIAHYFSFFTYSLGTYNKVAVSHLIRLRSRYNHSWICYNWSYTGIVVKWQCLTWWGSVAAIIIAEYITIDPTAQPQVEAGHLAQIHRVTVRMQDCESVIQKIISYLFKTNIFKINLRTTGTGTYRISLKLFK
jgi:hypothetical protein